MTEGTARSFPPYVSRVTQFLPLLPLERLIARAADRIASEHPEFFDRLDSYATRSFVIVPTDLDWIAALTFHNNRVQIRLARSLDAFPKRDVTVTAPFLSLLDLLDGQEDGDALFFSRDLTVEGDTEAVLACATHSTTRRSTLSTSVRRLPDLWPARLKPRARASLKPCAIVR